MTAETKAYIEDHINQIENNGIGSTYLDCPLNILNDFNNSMHIAGIEYPPEIHAYVVVCCYMSKYFRDVQLQSYDFDYNTEKEEYRFTCENCLYDIHRCEQTLSRLLPKRTIKMDSKCVVSMHTGNTILKFHITVI